MAGSSTYVDIPVTRARPSSPCSHLAEKFLTKRRNRTYGGRLCPEETKNDPSTPEPRSFFPLLLFLRRVRKEDALRTRKQNTDADRIVDPCIRAFVYPCIRVSVYTCIRVCKQSPCTYVSS